MSDDRSDLYQAALASLLPVLAEGMIHHGVTLRAAQDHLKQALVNAVLQTEGADVTDSRISLLTGVHRKDVKRLRQGPPVRIQTAQNPVALVMSEWRRLVQRRLTRKEFEALVKSARVDMAPGTVLDEMRRLGVVSGEDELTLNADALIPPAGSAEIYETYAKNLTAHLATATGNLAGNPPKYERAAHFNKLSPASVETLNTLAAKLGQEALEEFADAADALQKADADAKDATGRIAFGAYVNTKGKPE